MLPAGAYLDDAVLAWERTHLFAGAWVCAGRSAELFEAGMRRAVAVGDDAVLLVRGDDGRLRGFYNVCQHRAHELAPCGSTSQHRSIHCPYHGWRYGLDGTLLSTPRFDGPAGFDRSQHGLVPVAVEEWHGWVMVNASGDAPPIDAFLAGIEPRVADHEPERLVVGATHSYELATNWKLIVENYHECFHCPNIHPELCAVSPSTSGENAEGQDGFWVGGWQDLMPHAITMSLTGESPTTPLRRLQGEARRRIDYLGLLPNLLVSLHPDYVMTHRIDPHHARADRRRVPVAVRPRGRRRRRVRPVLRRRLLGPHQPPGLDGVRGRATRRRLARLPPGPLLHRRGRRGPVRPTRRRRLPGRRLDAGGPRLSRSFGTDWRIAPGRPPGRMAELDWSESPRLALAWGRYPSYGRRRGTPADTRRTP